ncbi:hypothetical protein PR003_g9913 [Phytophthora rubi]|uniref:Chromo domain-containing protein n=1 Tax=Phytophthora rubi TaxID=129364 RepID=A0A6A4F726_9STRA|nr:hypothetical protein PR003_g9913 [Phytophthora rubi]
MDPDKVQTIKDWPVPRTQDELHSFLGLTGYVQRFCPEYASLTATMFALLKKQNKRNAKIHFNDEQLKNFKELKRRLCNPPVLHLPDFNKPMRLQTDASKFAVGGVLFQVVDGAERPIAYTSRKMKSAELNYPTQQQELLAIVHSLAAFRIYCLDKPPIVETDHKRLEGLFTQKMANRRLARWYDILAEYQPTFSYLPGAKNGIADELSRRPDLQPETKFFHDLSVTSFDDTSFSLALSEVATDTDLTTNIKKAYKKDREIQTIFAAIKRRTADPKTKRVSQHHKKYRSYSEADGLLWYQTPTDDVPRIVVPNDLKLRQTIISECHDTNYGGHPGAERTYLTLARRWYWSKMLKSIQRFIADCEPCRRNKPRLTKPPGLLEPLSIPDERWRSISMDFITDLPRTKRDVDSIWVVVEKVYLRTKHLDPKHSGLPNSTKFGPKWIGPYTVVRKIHNHAYELNIQAGNKLHPVFNTGSLKPYKESTRLSRPGDVILADGSVGQIVKRLLGKRRHKRRTQFLVEWVGEEKPTWEPVENLTQIPDLIAEFEQTRRTKRRRR